MSTHSENYPLSTLRDAQNQLEDTFQICMLLSELFDQGTIQDLKLSVGARDGLSLLMKQIYDNGWAALDMLEEISKNMQGEICHE